MWTYISGCLKDSQAFRGLVLASPCLVRHAPFRGFVLGTDLRRHYVHLTVALQERTVTVGQLAVAAEDFQLVAVVCSAVLEIDHDGQRIPQRFHREADSIDGVVRAVLRTVHHHQQVLAVDPVGRCHPID